MRPVQIHEYEFDENSYGEILLGLPDLRIAATQARFKTENDDVLLMYENGDIVRIVAMARHLGDKAAGLKELSVVEVAGEQVMRSYFCERAA